MCAMSLSSQILASNDSPPDFFDEIGRLASRHTATELQAYCARLGVDRAAASDTLPASGLDPLQAHPPFVGADSRPPLRRQTAAPPEPQLPRSPSQLPRSPSQLAEDEESSPTQVTQQGWAGSPETMAARARAVHLHAAPRGEAQRGR